MFPRLVVVSTYLPTQVAMCKATVTKHREDIQIGVIDNYFLRHRLAHTLRAIRLAGHSVVLASCANDPQTGHGSPGRSSYASARQPRPHHAFTR